LLYAETDADDARRDGTMIMRPPRRCRRQPPFIAEPSDAAITPLMPTLTPPPPHDAAERRCRRAPRRLCRADITPPPPLSERIYAADSRRFTSADAAIYDADLRRARRHLERR